MIDSIQSNSYCWLSVISILYVCSANEPVHSRRWGTGVHSANEPVHTHLRQPHSPLKNAKTSYVTPITSISTVALWLHEFGRVCPLSLGSVPTQDLGFWDLATLHHSVSTVGRQSTQQLAGTDVLHQLYDQQTLNLSSSSSSSSPSALAPPVTCAVPPPS
jgi:hypothetical protein